METNPRRLLPLVVAISGMGVLTFSLILPALPDLADELGVSRGAIGLVQGAVAIPGVFLAVAIGYVADVRGRRFMALASLAIFGVAGVSGFFVRSFWPLVALRAVQGIGTSGLLSVGVVVVGDLFTGDERRWALGINSAGITLTALISPAVGGALADSGTFRPFLLFGLALPLMLWARLLPGRPEGPPPDRPDRHVRQMFRSMRSSGTLSDFAGLLPFSLAAMVVFAGFAFTTTPLFLEDSFGLGATARGLIISVLSIGASISTLNTARLAGRFGARPLFSLTLVVLTAAFTLVALAAELWVVALGLFLLGLGLGLLFPLLQDFVASSVPTEYRGVAVGTWISAFRLGQATGPVLATALAAGIGERPSYWIATAMTAVLAVSWQPLRRVAAGWIGPPDEGRRPVG